MSNHFILNILSTQKYLEKKGLKFDLLSTKSVYKSYILNIHVKTVFSIK